MKTDISHIALGQQVSMDGILELKNVMIIRYVHAWGGCFAERRWWQGEINGDVEDFNSVNSLIKQAEAQGIPWVVLRHHKNGNVSCLRKSIV